LFHSKNDLLQSKEGKKVPIAPSGRIFNPVKPPPSASCRIGRRLVSRVDLLKMPRGAGRELFDEKLLLLYVAYQSPRTPLWAKGVIAAAIACFISPIDAIPDAVPVIGYSDDLLVVTGALTQISMYVDDDVRRQAEEVLRNWGFV
jgi:uncharacterized membrane protein YkvA (DUF1232 family)